MKNQTLRAALFALSAAAVAPAALAGPLRIDNGSAIGDLSGTTWVPQTDSAAFDQVLDLGFGFNFDGSIAHSARINANGSIDLLENTLSTVSLGTITALTTATPFLDGVTWGAAVQPDSNPLPPLGTDPIDNAFRVFWTEQTTGLAAQITLFGLGSGQSLIEFNYGFTGFDVSPGVDLSGPGNTIGLISAGGSTQFDLGSFVTAGCLSTFGADSRDNATRPAPGTGCTGFFVDGVFSSQTLPSQFQFANGGNINNDDIADYRYLLQLTDTTTVPPTPTPVPEPGTLSLVALGLLAFGASRRGVRHGARAA